MGNFTYCFVPGWFPGLGGGLKVRDIWVRLVGLVNPINFCSMRRNLLRGTAEVKFDPNLFLKMEKKMLVEVRLGNFYSAANSRDFFYFLEPEFEKTCFWRLISFLGTL